MLQFLDMDMYKNLLAKSSTDNKVLSSIVREMRSNNVSPDLEKCLIRYKDVEHHVDELSKKNRNADALLEKAISYFKDGRIVLLNGELTSYDQYKLPSYILFIPFKDKILFNINGLKKTTWKKVGAEDYEYTFSNLIELKFALVTAQIMYEILVEGKDNLIINDQKLMPLITQTYVDFFKKAVGRIGASIDEWDKDKLNYSIAKFFYMHTLGYSEKESDKIVSNIYNYMDYEIADIKLSEESIDYDNLYTFIPTMTKLFYKKEISADNLINSWANSFGSSIFTEIEYFPALLTHILVLIFGIEFVNQKYDLRSKKEAIYQRLTVSLK